MPKANPNTPIKETSETRDRIRVFLHDDGTISDRSGTCGFTALRAEVAAEFFAAISRLSHADIAAAIKRANKGGGWLSNQAEQIMAGNSAEAIRKGRLACEDRRVF